MRICEQDHTLQTLGLSVFPNKETNKNTSKKISKEPDK